MRTLTGLLVTLLLTPIVAAQGDDAAETTPLRRYSVEIIVFTYAEDVSIGSEVFPPDKPIIAEDPFLFGDAGDLPDVAEPEPDTVEDTDEEAEEDRSPLEAILTLEEEFTLTDVVEKLELLDAYAPIMHVGWTQATVEEDKTHPLELPFFGEPPPGLEGSFKLYLGRYLHLVVDLALDEAEESLEETMAFDEPAFTFGDARLMYDVGYQAEEGPVRYRIQENRILKNGDIRYFDHPKFGVIAKVTRVERAEPEEGAEDAGLLFGR